VARLIRQGGGLLLRPSGQLAAHDGSACDCCEDEKYTCCRISETPCPNNSAATRLERECRKLSEAEGTCSGEYLTLEDCEQVCADRECPDVRYYCILDDDRYYFCYKDELGTVDPDNMPPGYRGPYTDPTCLGGIGCTQFDDLVLRIEYQYPYPEIFGRASTTTFLGNSVGVGAGGGVGPCPPILPYMQHSGANYPFSEFPDVTQIFITDALRDGAWGGQTTIQCRSNLLFLTGEDGNECPPTGVPCTLVVRLHRQGEPFFAISERRCVFYPAGCVEGPCAEDIVATIVFFQSGIFEVAPCLNADPP
jgi:hypothetical protein